MTEMGNSQPTSTTSTNTTGESTPLLLKHFGTGLDGTLVVNEAETIKVNRYARVLQISTKGSTKIEVSCTEIFTTGKEVYIIQMKGSNDSQSLFARIVYVDHKNSIITINTELTFNCNSTGNNRCQVVTVPHFENVTLKARATITAAPWNGDSGGIIVFRSKQIVHVGQTSSKISVNGIGFRGGRYGATLMQNGSHGTLNLSNK
ncbi:uncharacterized protein LOC134183391 isoform X2 [Corticium candelabrum]|uniref:uncharacterized protein LOC134183391 isoform X2 n=1 Tax=Corticium candelabrum TaxID=121492 RepID=UPI002E252B8D|nr:uncharacterized protein LOC134183391 isoform X2 [Corticium candelabrum]